ncbi:MAG: hypothetical protein ACOYVK_07405 [Bacillota bacterium]
MRVLSEDEKLSLVKILQMEADAIKQMKNIQGFIDDKELKRLAEAGILDSEVRIKGLRQFINENQVIDIKGVH